MNKKQTFGTLNQLLILLGFCAIVLCCKPGKITSKTQTSANKKIFEYQNPIRNGIDKGMRDCQVFEDGGKYYLIGTSYPFWYWQKEKNPGIKIYSSDDLLNWNFEKLLIDRSKLDTTVWYLDRFWAPEIHKLQGKYYLLFNCQNESTLGAEFKGQHGGVAVSDNVLGDYTVLTHEAPFVRGNDLTFFEDNDKKVYAFFNRDKIIHVSEVDLENMRLLGVQFICFPAGKMETGDWDGIGIEGAYCIQKNGTYYLFYSSWSRGYEIGYALANHPLGPWVKYEGNPIYGAQNKMKCEKNKLDFTGDPESPWLEVGHNEVFEGPDGRLWISCHGKLKDDPTPYLVIDPIDFVDGAMKIDGPSYTNQIIKY